MDTDTKAHAAPSATIAAGPLYVPLRDRAGEIVAYAVLDAEDAALAEHRWFQNRGGGWWGTCRERAADR